MPPKENIMIAGVMMAALFLNKYCVKAWIELMWAGKETSGRILRITSRFIKHGKFRDQHKSTKFRVVPGRDVITITTVSGNYFSILDNILP